MTNKDVKDQLSKLEGEYKNKGNEITVEKIKHLQDLVDKIIPDCVCEVIHSVKYFLLTQRNQSCLDANINDSLDSMIDEARAYIEVKCERIQKTAITEMRKSRKGSVIVAIIILSSIAGIAAVLGVLGAVGIMSEVYCNIVGVVDCIFGISFFIYELYSDKLVVSEINSGDTEKIKKYTKEIPLIGNIIHIEKQENKAGNVINSGTWIGSNYGNNYNVISKDEEISDIISKLFDNQKK